MFSLQLGNQLRRSWLTRLPWVTIVVLLCGCHRDSNAPFPVWTPTPAPATSGGAYSTYRSIGTEAEAVVRGLQPRAAPTALEIKELDAKLTPFLAKVADANRLRVTDEYAAQPSLQPDPARIGWTFIGRAFARRVHTAIAQKDYDSAVTYAVEGMRFALIIACGDATDALVGLPIADEIRRTLTPALRDFSPAQLSKLANGISAALFERLPPQALAAHEHLAMMAAIEGVQDAYRDGRLVPLEAQLGQTVHESIEVLSGYRGNAESKRVAFFAAMAADADDESNWLAQAVITPPSQRAKEPNPKVTSKKPWNALARQFILAGGPMVDATDKTLARTRMLAMTCQILAVAKTSGAAPRDLGTFPRQLNTDPFTGKSFFYVPVGLDFRLYSAGPDGIDNDGEPDDLKLEDF
jgi:hypothetical protein